MKRILFVMTIMFVLLTFAGFGFAQQAKPELSSQDKNFVKDAAMDNQMEVQLGQLAARQASSQDVKTFGQRMVNDHSKASRELMSLAQQKGLSAPTSLDSKRQKKINDLAKKTGADFDRAYMSEMAKEHRSDINKFEKQARDGKDPDLKNFASRTLSVLRDHEQAVAQIQPRVASR